MFHYRVAGLTVASQTALPGLRRADIVGEADVDVHIYRRSVPLDLDRADRSGPNWQSLGTTLLLRVPGILRMLILEGREIRFEPDADADAADLPVFLSGTGLGILMHQRKRLVLQASAISVNGRAVLFCGRSGAGKSTLAVALSGLGHPILADDFCCLSRGPTGLDVQGDGRAPQLWDRAIVALGVGDRAGKPVRPALMKRHLSHGGDHQHTLPLGMIYELQPANPASPPGIRQPRSVDGIHILLRNAYRPALLRHLDQGRDYFGTAAELMTAGRIRRCAQVMEFSDLPDSLRRLESHWREAGLLAGDD